MGVQAAAAEQQFVPWCLRAALRNPGTAWAPVRAGWDATRARRAIAGPLHSPPSREAKWNVRGNFSAFLIFAPCWS